MRDNKEMLEYYGKCCVTEEILSKDRCYEAGPDGGAHQLRDRVKLESIRGQKKAIEWFFK